mmetsp:Transcript_62944/g.147733  ORF Transcript_62944/g.147733 Transcript_62944/m.147733 type:complete len:238 (-) Transcript_62944:2-715(-)
MPSSAGHATDVGKIEGLEGHVAPAALDDHLRRQVGHSLLGGCREFVSLLDREGCQACGCNELPFLQRIQLGLAQGAQRLQLFLRTIFHRIHRQRADLGCLVNRHPLVFHARPHANLGNSTKRGINVCVGNRALGLDETKDLELRASVFAVLLTLLSQLPAFSLDGLRGDLLLGLEGLDRPDQHFMVPAFFLAEGLRILKRSLRLQVLYQLLPDGRCHESLAGSPVQDSAAQNQKGRI